MSYRQDQIEIKRRIKLLQEHFGKIHRLPVHRSAAEVVKQSIVQLAPVGDRVNRRYSTSKKRKRSRVLATYFPGNLKRSIKIRDFNTAYAYVLPTAAKSSRGVFKGQKADGYYAHMVEYGTIDMAPRPFMRVGLARSAKQAIQILKSGFRQILSNYRKKLRHA